MPCLQGGDEGSGFDLCLFQRERFIGSHREPVYLSGMPGVVDPFYATYERGGREHFAPAASSYVSVLLTQQAFQAVGQVAQVLADTADPGETLTEPASAFLQGGDGCQGMAGRVADVGNRGEDIL